MKEEKINIKIKPQESVVEARVINFLPEGAKNDERLQ